MRKESDNKSVQEQTVAAIGAAHLLHPELHFDHPRDVLAAEQIGRDEKRAILASWASDISAIESMPALRRYPGMERVVTYDEILDALKALDNDGQSVPGQASPVSFDVSKTCRRRAGARRLRDRFGLFNSWKGGHRRQLIET